MCSHKMLRHHSHSIRRQQGLVLVLVTAALLALAGMMALAIDVNHALLNKSRLQNGVDSAALAAAIVLDNGGTDADAQAMVTDTLNQLALSAGNDEIDFSGATVSVTFSNDPETFPDPGYSAADDNRFVRVAVTNYSLDDFFASIFGVTKSLSASAVAGPSSANTNVCNLVPVAVCAGEDSGTGDGYNTGEIYALKLADQTQSSMGSGNYQLLDFGSGADTVRDAMAGGFEGCVDTLETVKTKPGGTVGPVGQGLNTRFGVYGGGGVSAADYPPDIYVKEPDPPATMDDDGNIVYTAGWGYSDYEAGATACDADSSGENCRADGEHDRRIIPVPIVDCSTASGGTTEFSIVSLGCFFLLQQAPTSNAGDQVVFGEFIEDCTIKNGTSGNSSSDEGPYRIVLYKDPLGEGS
ncbi:pilus assembly protein TadG-related protein [Vibrio mangrovi]|uniref:Pilus assembly protein TadG-related protein n=1 Tax=Vibrio mangrovi TaxID=474394 RepID=A0A1Y6IYK9_9VIBR|nr:pilus assembly protein TadG-related protein [Vibrio mangrovi]MDW6002352.1 pilus assembly protein TadG-related protein [Vibrio mangrovi]SMS02749.1 hypothetical protein VIM7927_04089 [Vibrio mangrovi]